MRLVTGYDTRMVYQKGSEWFSRTPQEVPLKVAHALVVFSHITRQPSSNASRWFGEVSFFSLLN